MLQDVSTGASTVQVEGKPSPALRLPAEPRGFANRGVLYVTVRHTLPLLGYPICATAHAGSDNIATSHT